MTLTVDGRSRQYLLSVPESPRPGASILFVLHPSARHASDMWQILGRTLERITRDDNTLLVYPEGFEGHFNDCRRAADYSARTLDIDDVGFMRAIVAQLVRSSGRIRARSTRSVTRTAVTWRCGWHYRPPIWCAA